VSLDRFVAITALGGLERHVAETSYVIARKQIGDGGWSLRKPIHDDLLSKLRCRRISLTEYVNGRMYRGIVTGLNKAFIIDEKTRDALIKEDPNCEAIIKPIVAGRDVKRYSIAFRGQYIIFTRRGTRIEQYPTVLRYLSQFRKALTPKTKLSDGVGRKPGRYKWYEIQDTIDYYEEFEREKIIYPDISVSCRFALDRDGLYGSNTTYFIPLPDLYLLGVLNSTIAQFYLSSVCAGLEGGGTIYLRLFGEYLEKFPVPNPSLNDPCDRARHDRMVSLVQRMLELHKRLQEASTDHEKTLLQRQIAAADREIDQLVYELYDLTPEEIAIVEESTR